MPLEAGWRFTMQWKADNMSCKLLMVVRALGYYLSSAILVMLCVDRYSSQQLTCFQYIFFFRYLVIRHPMTTLRTNLMRRRAWMMIIFSWILSIILSFPQALTYRLLKHPSRYSLAYTSYKHNLILNRF